jgi:M-phase phosphoprotein 6
MWKPGTEKPAAQQTKSETRSTSTTTPDSSKKRKTELSSVTKSMRFMQRCRTTASTLKDAEQEDDSMELDTAGAVDGDGIQPHDASISSTNEESYLDKATPAEMYGIERSVAIGRRSFGGFNGVVAENWFRQKQEIFPKKKKSIKSQREEENLLRQFDELERNEKKTQGKNKKRTNGISNGTNKRTKTLDDILSMASP